MQRLLAGGLDSIVLGSRGEGQCLIQGWSQGWIRTSSSSATARIWSPSSRTALKPSMAGCCASTCEWGTPRKFGRRQSHAKQLCTAVREGMCVQLAAASRRIGCRARRLSAWNATSQWICLETHLWWRCAQRHTGSVAMDPAGYVSTAAPACLWWKMPLSSSGFWMRSPGDGCPGRAAGHGAPRCPSCTPSWGRWTAKPAVPCCVRHDPHAMTGASHVHDEPHYDGGDAGAKRLKPAVRAPLPHLQHEFALQSPTDHRASRRCTFSTYCCHLDRTASHPLLGHVTMDVVSHWAHLLPAQLGRHDRHAPRLRRPGVGAVGDRREVVVEALPGGLQGDAGPQPLVDPQQVDHQGPVLGYLWAVPGLSAAQADVRWRTKGSAWCAKEARKRRCARLSSTWRSCNGWRRSIRKGSLAR